MTCFWIHYYAFTRTLRSRRVQRKTDDVVLFPSDFHETVRARRCWCPFVWPCERTAVKTRRVSRQARSGMGNRIILVYIICVCVYVWMCVLWVDAANSLPLPDYLPHTHTYACIYIYKHARTHTHMHTDGVDNILQQCLREEGEWGNDPRRRIETIQ